MRIAPVAEIKERFSEYLRVSQKEAVIVTRNGRAVALITGISDDDDLERLLMGRSPHLRAILNAARERIRAGEGLSHEAFWERVEAEAAQS